MGASNNSISREKLLKPSQKHLHLKFAQALQYEDSDKIPYYTITQSIPNISIFNKWQKKLKQIKRKLIDHSLLLPLSEQYQQQGICGSAGIIKLKFDHFPYILEEEIMNRQTEKLEFQDKELWFLLYILTQTTTQMHTIDCLIGDIRPRNVFINKMGDITLYNLYTFPEQHTNFQKVIFYQQTTYLPPEGIKDIQKGFQNPTYNEFKGQSFSIGLTMLDAIFLKDHSYLYTYNKNNGMTFDLIQFDQAINKLMQKQMNPVLKKIIISLLIIHPQQRIFCQQLYILLRPYEKNIFELQNFQILQDFNQAVKQMQKQISGKVSYSEQPQRINTNPISLGSKKNSASKQTMPIIYDTKSKQQIDQVGQYNYGTTKTIINKINGLENSVSISRVRQKGSMASISNSIPKQNNVASTKNNSMNKNYINIAESQVNRVQVTNIPIFYTQNQNNNQPLIKIIDQESLKNMNIQQVNGPNATFMQFKTGNLFRKQRQSETITQQFSPYILNDYSTPLVQKSEYKHIIENNVQKKATNLLQQQERNYRQISTYSLYPNGQNISINRNYQLYNQPLNNTSINNNNNYEQFLRKIERQLQQSKKLFPSK